MKMNFECSRSLMQTIRSTQTVSANGKPLPLHLKRLYSLESLSDYSAEEINTAALYLVDKKLIRLMDGQVFPQTAPRAFTICGITGAGYDYLAAVDNDTVWNHVKKKLGSVDLASAANVIAIAAQFFSGV